MPPTKIMIVRHGEKPGAKKDRPPDGVDWNGAVDQNSLTVQGWQRAGGLAELFAPGNGSFPNSSLARPDSIYASGTITSKSLRPQQTITPLAQKLDIKINVNYNPAKSSATTPGVQHEKELIRNVLQQAGVILICWQHELIPEIASHIPLTPGTTYPKTWCSDRFDLVWAFDLAGGSQPESPQYTFVQVPQNLLAGDSTAPMQDPCPQPTSQLPNSEAE